MPSFFPTHYSLFISLEYQVPKKHFLTWVQKVKWSEPMTETLIVAMTMTLLSHKASFPFLLECISHSMLEIDLVSLLFSPETYPTQMRLYDARVCGIGVRPDDRWIASLWLHFKKKKKQKAPHTCSLLCVSCPWRELCCSLWCSSALQLWKCLFIQDAVARPAGSSLTAFWQSNITSSWAQDNHPLSRTLSYLSRLEALQFYHAHAVISFFFFSSRTVGFFAPCFIYLSPLFWILNDLFCLRRLLKTGWIIWCGSLLPPHPDR